MKHAPLLYVLSSAVLAGCAIAPSNLAQPDEATVTLQPSPRAGGLRTQAEIDAYGQADIKHLVVKAFKLVNGSEEELMANGAPITRDIPNNQLGAPVAFGHLHRNTKYRVRAYAYSDTATASLISTTDAGSYVDITVGFDDRPTVANLPVRLVDRTFSGWASGSVAISSGTLGHSGDEGVGAAAYPYGYTMTYSGLAGQSDTTDGTGAGARFKLPSAMARDHAGNLYVVDGQANNIRKMTPAGVVTTFAGSLTSVGGHQDGVGTDATFNAPSGLTIDGLGNLYVVESQNNTIRKITPQGVVSTVAGMAGASGTTDGTGPEARFKTPGAIVVDGAGTLYVADYGNQTIRTITAAGVTGTLAGIAGASGSVDATGTAAAFWGPSGLALDGLGNLYVADSFNHAIRKIDLETKEVTTLAGTLGQYGLVDGTGSAAGFFVPFQLTMDGTDSLYVTEPMVHRIRKVVASTGVVITLAGTVGVPGATDGVGTSARFFQPYGLVADSVFHYLWVADGGNHTLRRISL